MKYHFYKTLIAFLVSSALYAHSATIVISQTLYSNLNDYSPRGFGQSFTSDENYQLSAIDLYISSSSGGSNATVSLYGYNSATSELGSTLLGSGRFLESSLSDSGSWLRVNFDAPVSVSGGNEYAFLVVADDPGGSTGWNNYGVSNSDEYAEGSRILGSGSKDTNDLAFAIVAVPEPSSIVLLALGALGLTVHRRRSTKAQKLG